jgi:hypothetical protein
MDTPKPACKCCNGATSFFAQYDFSRTCEDPKGAVFARSGVGIPYFRCMSCGFVFASYFDGWSKQDFAERIYNADYRLADPDFAATRPQYIAGQLSTLLAPIGTGIRILDYGGGEGRLIRELQRNGFEKSESFDPFFSSDIRPAGLFDLVTMFEVAEHAVDPLQPFQDALSFLAPGGALLFSTALQKHKPDRDWWYIAPRNGHISIHTAASLQRVAAAAGARCLSLDDNVHLLYRDERSRIARQIADAERDRALYEASRHGLQFFLQTAAHFNALGAHARSRDARHLARAILSSGGFV